MTFVELFFDLVFVFCVTQVVTLLHGHIDAKSSGSAMLVFWLVWWAGAIVLDLLAAGVGGQLEGWNLHPDHFVERHGLIVIIALGETLIVAAAGLVEAPPTATTLLTGMLAVAVTSALWWVYFHRARPTLEHELSARTGNARSCLARDAFSVLHFPMLCGVIAIAAVTEEALAHPTEPMGLDLRLALGVGAVLFVGGSALALWRATGRLPMWRSLLMPASAGAILALGSMPAAALGLLLAALVTLAIIDDRQPQLAISERHAQVG